MKRIDNSNKNARKEPPARTPEEQENRNICYANDLAEKQLRNGTASSQTINYFLQKGSVKEKYERVILEKEIELLTAKTEAIKSQKRVEELYSSALRAMRSYNGEEPNDEEDENF